jgi:hypothetical protein
MGRRKAKEDIIVLRTFHVQWINHPTLGCAEQYVAEDVLFEDLTTDLQSFGVADELDYNGAMVHFIGGNMCIITRDRDLRIPIGRF